MQLQKKGLKALETPARVMTALPNALGTTHRGSGKNKNVQEDVAPLLEQPTSPALFCVGPWSVDEARVETTGFHGSWSVSLDWTRLPTSLLGFPTCRWQILRLPMVQLVGLPLPSNLCTFWFLL